jgi:hypothetical protein
MLTGKTKDSTNLDIVPVEEVSEILSRDASTLQSFKIEDLRAFTDLPIQCYKDAYEKVDYIFNL